MSVIKIKNITKSYGDNLVLDNIKLDINENDKIGIVGPNGSGKTTLLRLILGIEKPDSGNIIISANNTGYLKQVTDYSKEDFINISDDKEKAKMFLKTLSELNIDKKLEFTTERLEGLSGGEKTKIALSQVLSKNPSILILDEPTNHVDIDSVEWLISKLKSFNKTIILVSHDRYFLNQVVNKIVEIEDGNIKEYIGNYDEYARQKAIEEQSLREKYIREQKGKKKVEKEIHKLKQWSSQAEHKAGRNGDSDSRASGVKDKHQRRAAKLARSAKQKETKLERMKNNETIKPKDRKDIKFSFNNDETGSKVLVKLENISKKYNEKVIFSNVNIEVNTKEKIGLIGPNGCGKTTLIKIITEKEKPSSGTIWKTPSLKVAYMSQDVINLDEEKTILDLTYDYDSNKKQLFLSNLVNMGFDRELFKNKIKTLSLGQRMRVKLAQIILDKYNLLILDEPTNHLDIENKLELENALNNFPGTIIIASHDKYLLSKITNKLFIFNDKTITRREYGNKDYTERR